MTMLLPKGKQVLCILYSSGGTADVGRHAVQAALDLYEGPIRVLSKDPFTLAESNWNCACPSQHHVDLSDDRLDVRAVDVTKDDLTEHLKDVGAVISGLGNRQPWHGDCVAAKGTANLVKAMENNKIKRLIAITSVGCNEDWPPMEFHWAGKILKWILRIGSRREYKDLCLAEDVVREQAEDSKIDYLLVRPVGLGEDRPPVNEWVVQKEKYKDKLGPDMSKLDCARFCLKEAVEPTYHCQAVVVGSDFDKFELNPKEN